MGRPINEGTYLKTLQHLSEGITQVEIARMQKVSEAAISKRIKRLKKMELITVKKAWPNVINLTSKGKVAVVRQQLNLTSPRQRKGRPKKPIPKGQLRLHNLTILIPVLRKGRPLPVRKNVAMNNWMRKILNIDLPYKATLEFLDVAKPKIKVKAHDINLPRSFGGYLQVVEHIQKVVACTHSAVMQYGWILDSLHTKVTTQEIAAVMPELRHMEISPTRLELDREAESVTGKTGQTAAVWIDKSKGVPEVETNDLKYEEQFMQMPIKLDNMEKDMHSLGQFARGHELLIVTLNDLMRKLEAKL